MVPITKKRLFQEGVYRLREKLKGEKEWFVEHMGI
jgi:hypothetical protein